jgi:adenylate cyclase
MKVLEADGYRYQMNKEANVVAKRLLEEAVRLDPNYALAHIDLSCALAADVWLGASDSPPETLAQAMKEAQRAVELDGSSAEAQAAVSYVFLLLHQHDKAIAAAERAMRLNPNSLYAIVALAVSMIYSFRCEETLPWLRQAIRLDPLYPQIYNLFGVACRETGSYEEGIAAVRKTLQLSPNNVLAHLALTTLYSYAGRAAEARAAAADLMRINPNFSLIKYAKEVPYKEGPSKDRVIDALRQAGLK